jgi:hypothetical protein
MIRQLNFFGAALLVALALYLLMCAPVCAESIAAGAICLAAAAFNFYVYLRK